MEEQDGSSEEPWGAVRSAPRLWGAVSDGNNSCLCLWADIETHARTTPHTRGASERIDSARWAERLDAVVRLSPLLAAGDSEQVIDRLVIARLATSGGGGIINELQTVASFKLGHTLQVRNASQ